VTNTKMDDFLKDKKLQMFKIDPHRGDEFFEQNSYSVAVSSDMNSKRYISHSNHKNDSQKKEKREN
jgi:hypothetical protein